MINRADQDGIVLVDLPAGQTQRRTAFAVALVLSGSAVVAAPFASVQLRQFEAFIPVSQTFIFVNDLITSVLLIAQFVIVRWRAILVLASGYLFTALIDVTQLLTFPGTFTPTGLLGAGLQTTGWLYEFWHSGFPIAVILYVVLKNQAPENRVSHKSARAAVAISVAVVIGMVLGLSWLATAGEEYLPKLFLDRSRQAPAAAFFSGLVLLVSIVALLMLWFRQRSVLDLWLMVAMCAWSLDIVTQTVAGSRFTLGFYASRVYALVTATTVLIVLLWETMTLYARLALSVFAQRREREARLMTGDVVAASIAHEVKQPLTAMVTSADAGFRFLD
ncbi:MAG TPA: MASE4 domain-containing protein, partial [Casimicrobiaceae bacterium]